MTSSEAVLADIVRVADNDLPVSLDRRGPAYELDQPPFLDQHHLQQGPGILIEAWLVRGNGMPAPLCHALQADRTLDRQVKAGPDHLPGQRQLAWGAQLACKIGFPPGPKLLFCHGLCLSRRHASCENHGIAASFAIRGPASAYLDQLRQCPQAVITLWLPLLRLRDSTGNEAGRCTPGRATSALSHP